MVVAKRLRSYAIWVLSQRTGMEEGSIVTVFRVKQKLYYFEKGGNRFLLNGTDLQNYTASPPQKVIFNWLCAEISTLSSRYLFRWIRNFCKLATIWPLALFTKQRQYMLLLTRSITYPSKIQIILKKNFGASKRPKLYKLRNLRA